MYVVKGFSALAWLESMKPGENSHTTPVVAACGTNFRFDLIWPPWCNLHKSLKLCIQVWEMHVCIKGVSALAWLEAMKPDANKHITPAVAAHQTIFRFSPIWPQWLNLHKSVKLCIQVLEMHVCDWRFLSSGLNWINEAWCKQSHNTCSYCMSNNFPIQSNMATMMQYA